MQYFTTILVALVVIILAVYYYRQYVAYRKHQAKITWPKNVNPCPDYWVSTGRNKCKNVKNIGKCTFDKNNKLIPDGEMDFSGSVDQGKNGALAKCNGARNCKSSWQVIDDVCS